MRRPIAVALLTCALLSIASPPCHAGQLEDQGTGRKAIVKVKPVYPDLARRMRLTGSVKVGVVVSANGTVRSTRVIGGNPVLVLAAEEAVKQWRYEAAPAESTEFVELKFDAR